MKLNNLTKYYIFLKVIMIIIITMIIIIITIIIIIITIIIIVRQPSCGRKFELGTVEN